MDIGSATFSGHGERLAGRPSRACTPSARRLERYPAKLRTLLWIGLALLAWGGVGGAALGAFCILRTAAGLF